MKYDLHSHTTCSDGSFSVSELLTQAKETGLDGLSITDHDTISAYKEAPQIAGELGLKLLSGIEFNSEYNGMSLHILGYGFAINDPQIVDFVSNCHAKRGERNKRILGRLNELGVKISETDFSKELGSIGRPHMAQVMIDKGYVQTRKEAFDRYIDESSPGFVGGCRFIAQEVVETLHKANAFAVIAHPHLMPKGTPIEEILDLGFDGLECFYARMPVDREREWHEIAQRKSLLQTGGSDFHGESKPNIPLGCSWVAEETFDQLYKRYQDNELLHAS